jgi:hypothetical protein
MFVTVLHYGLFLPKSEEHPLRQASAVGIVRFSFYSPDQAELQAFGARVRVGCCLRAAALCCPNSQKGLFVGYA